MRPLFVAITILTGACKGKSVSCEDVGAHLGGTNAAATERFTTWCKLGGLTEAQRECAMSKDDPAAAAECAK